MFPDFVKPSKVLNLMKSVVFFLLLSIAIVLAIGLINRDLAILLLDIFFLGPTLVFVSIVYILVKRKQIKYKKKKLVGMFDEVADQLERDPATLTLFDVRTHNDTRFIWDGAIAPFLIATVRLFLNAKANIISEESGRHKSWTGSLASPIEELARQTKKIAVAVEESDPVSSFEAIGDLYAVALMKRKQITRAQTKLYTQNNFVADAERISALLKRRDFVPASNYLKEMVNRIMCQELVDTKDLRWQALIANWLALRFVLMEAPSDSNPSALWLGPSRVLSMQLDAVLLAYVEKNYTTISEIIYESFDWRTRVPRLLAH